MSARAPGQAPAPQGSENSESSQTAEEFIQSQLKLELDAREALPYQFDTCTSSLGPLRQLLFSCLTCNPPPEDPTTPYNTAAAVCYSCSISCHGDHHLVELFNKRDFTCDCGTARFSPQVPCTLQINPKTRRKGGVHSAEPRVENKYGKNFRNSFCGCNSQYNPDVEQGTMFQCIGLPGGCGEDWWHPECVVGLARDWYKTGAKGDLNMDDTTKNNQAHQGEPVTVEKSLQAKLTAANLKSATENGQNDDVDEDGGESDPPLPPGFPGEDDFESFICYVCLDANPWLKKYGSMGGKFLPPVVHNHSGASLQPASAAGAGTTQKRKADEMSANDANEVAASPSVDTTEQVQEPKRHKCELPPFVTEAEPGCTSGAESSPFQTCKLESLPPVPEAQFSLFLASDFRDDLCRCSRCLSKLANCPGVLEEEETYEPPLSEDGSANGQGDGSLGSHSLYSRGEAALNTVDRVRALDGIMAFNTLKEKLKTFLQPFAESKTAVSAEDIKAYFAQLRGDKGGVYYDPENEDPSFRSNSYRREGEGY